MFKYLFTVNDNIFCAFNIILALLVVMNNENTISTHYFHQYPHDLHNKTIEYQLLEPNINDNVTFPPTNLSDHVKSKLLLPTNLPSIEVIGNNYSISQVVTIDESGTTNQSIELTRTRTDTSDVTTQNCTSTWQCEWGRQCIDSICILGCRNNTDCKSKELCEPYLGRCIEKPMEGIVFKNGYMYGKSALEGKATNLCSQQFIQFLLIILELYALVTLNDFCV